MSHCCFPPCHTVLVQRWWLTVVYAMCVVEMFRWGSQRLFRVSVSKNRFSTLLCDWVGHDIIFFKCFCAVIISIRFQSDLLAGQYLSCTESDSSANLTVPGMIPFPPFIVFQKDCEHSVGWNKAHYSRSIPQCSALQCVLLGRRWWLLSAQSWGKIFFRGNYVRQVRMDIFLYRYTPRY